MFGKPDPFLDARFLGGRQKDKRDPERLRLFHEHLEEGERVRWVLPCRNSTLLLTDRRLMDLRPHLTPHGAWNVMRFTGYSLYAEIPAGTADEVLRKPAPTAPGGKPIGGETLQVRAQGKTFEFVTEPFGEDFSQDDLAAFARDLGGE